MKRIICAVTVTLVTSMIVLARNPADLKRDLAALAPANSKVRLAWIKGGPFTEFPFYAYNTVVYVVDSDDGVIRRLYPATGSGNFDQVDITADGSRVLFYNKDTGRLCKINWDGSGFKEVDLGGEVIEYWRHPTAKSDWALVYVNNMSRVNIDTPTVKVPIGAPGIAGNGGSGLSDDGTKLVGYCYQGCTGGPFGIVNTSSLQWSMGPHGGCWCSMSAGAAPKYNHNPSGHTQMCVHDAANQSTFTVYEVAKAIGDSLTKRGLKLPPGPANGCGEWPTTEGNRFTQHPEYVTLMYSESKVNPILMHLPDMKFVYIEDTLSCGFCGDMDAVFLPKGISNAKAPKAPASVFGRELGIQGAFLPDGRQIDPTKLKANGKRGSAAKGIVIRQVQGTTAGGSVRLAVEID